MFKQGNFTIGNHACHDGQNWGTIAEVPGFADAGDSVTTPQQDQVVQEKAVEQQPAAANASNSSANKKKIILWAGIGGVATLLVAGLLIWLLGGDEAVQDAQEKEASPQSNQSPASPPDAKIAQVGKIDLNDPKTRKKIIAKAVKHPSKMNLLQNRGKKGEELLYRKNQPKPYTGWTKDVWLGNSKGQIRRLTQYKGGQKHGLQTLWRRNGQKEGEHTYKDGKQHGLMTWWYENGQKKAETTFTDDKVMTSVVWRPNGEKCPATNVVNGNGAKVWYNNDGTVKRRVTYRDGEPVED
jgi:antitoxin component YwqK of YwqJK toxin-antitoxin module